MNLIIIMEHIEINVVDSHQHFLKLSEEIIHG